MEKITTQGVAIPRLGFGTFRMPGADAQPVVESAIALAPDQLHEQLRGTDFTEVEVQTIVQDIEFPSVLDYVRFQLLATPMAALLSDPAEFDRQATIKTIASETAGFSDPAMLEGGRFCFRQKAYVGTARNTN